MIHNPAMECMPREEMRKLQSERLVKTVKTCYEKVPFYKKKMDRMGIKPDDIKSIDDITKLPFTTKYDLRDEYPFGMQAVPMSEIRRIHASSGTTGKPVVGTYTQNDLDNWAECVARVLAVGDIGPGDVVQVSYGYGLFTVVSRLAFYYLYSVSRTCRKAVTQSVTVIVAKELRLAVNHANRALMASRRTRSASVAFFFIYLNDPSDHKKIPPHFVCISDSVLQVFSPVEYRILE